MKIRHGMLFISSIDEDYITYMVETKMKGRIMDIQFGDKVSIITCQSEEFDLVDASGPVPKYWADLNTLKMKRVK